MMDIEKAKSALLQLISAVEQTGGIFYDGGMENPISDPGWFDLALAYTKACAALDRPEMVQCSIDYNDDGEAVATWHETENNIDYLEVAGVTFFRDDGGDIDAYGDRDV